MAFHFRLERVLRLRRDEEEEALLELGRATSEVNRIEAEIATRQGLKTGAEALRYSSGVENIVTYTRYITRLENEIASLTTEREAALEVLEEKREAYLEKRRETKKLSILRDKEYQAWRKEERKEQNRKTMRLANPQMV
jgi:flagellar FliJ protein